MYISTSNAFVTSNKQSRSNNSELIVINRNLSWAMWPLIEKKVRELKATCEQKFLKFNYTPHASYDT